MARLGILFLCVILAACAPITAPLGLQNGEPAAADDAFVTRDGVRLPMRHWDSQQPRAVILALHGMNDYSNAFAMPAPVWSANAIATYAYDQRGFGSAPYAGLWPGETAMRRDLSDCIAALKARHPGVPLYLLGESMGAAVVLTALASDEPPPVDGVILVAPAVWSRADMPFHYRAALWLTAHTVPWMTLTGSGLKIWPSDNIEMLRAFSRDPKVIKETRADAIWGIAGLMDDARAASDKVKNPSPMLIVYGAKDQIIPRAPTEAAVASLAAAGSVDVRIYANGYHMLLRGMNGPEVWADIVSWIDARTFTASPPTR